MRERLIELLRQEQSRDSEVIADYLLSNGVIVPPCKVGDKVYVIYDDHVSSAIVLAFYIDRDGGMFDL